MSASAQTSATCDRLLLSGSSRLPAGEKTVGSARTEYYYDDMQLAEVRTNGVASEQFVYDTRYLHSVALRDRDTDGDGDCADATGSERLFYCNDGNFNVTALVSANGTVVERYTYDPYGKVTIRDANWQPITWDTSQKNVCLYTGHKFDAESGLYYSIYRYYHPGLGRWATRDPIGEIAIGQLQRFNIRTSDDQSQTRAEIARVLNVRTLTNEKRSSLRYLMNNSLSHIDALGLFEIVVTKPATPGICEACTFEVEFKVTKADPKDKTKKDDPNGWIIQHVKLESNEPRKCDHPHDIVKPAKNKPFEYWEAWQIEDGVAYNVSCSDLKNRTKPALDTYQTLSEVLPLTYGKLRVVGKVKLIPNYPLNIDPGSIWGCNTPLSSAPTSLVAPPGWDEKDAKQHDVTCDWACCAPKCKIPHKKDDPQPPPDNHETCVGIPEK